MVQFWASRRNTTVAATKHNTSICVDRSIDDLSSVGTHPPDSINLIPLERAFGATTFAESFVFLLTCGRGEKKTQPFWRLWVRFGLRSALKIIISTWKLRESGSVYWGKFKDVTNYQICIGVLHSFCGISKFRLDQRIAPAIRNFHTIYYSENYLKNWQELPLDT